MQWITAGSSWVHSYAYDAGDLYVRYKDKQGQITVTCWYQNVPLSMWTDLLAAPSKGKWVHANLMPGGPGSPSNWPYTLI